MRTRNSQLNVRMKPEQKERLRQTAARCGLNISSFICMIADGFEPKAAPPLEYTALMETLRGIENRLPAGDADTHTRLQQTLLELQRTVTVPERKI